MRRLRKTISVLTAVTAYLGLNAILYAQGTTAETVTTMELQQQMQMRSGEAQPQTSPVQKAENAPQEDTIARYEKVAQKLLKSMQSGRFDEADFSESWLVNLPPNASRSESINTLIRPVFMQLGRTEKLLEGKIVSPGRAAFGVQFSGGVLNMIIGLDSQDKINEWILTPPAAQAAPASPATAEQQATQAETPEVPEDLNEPDINDFNSFQRELNRVNIETRSEEQEWLAMPVKKIELARAIEELVNAQLRFIRKLAESQDPNQTIKAIDLVLRQRRERLNTLETKLSEEIREERQQQVGGEQPAAAPRGGGEPRMPRQPRTPRERPTRRPPAEGQQ
jgi:hypothetical protein